MDAKLEDIGALCAFCSARDYLPFQCKDCKKWYCLEHATSHDCPVEKTVTKPQVQTRQKVEVLVPVSVPAPRKPTPVSLPTKSYFKNIFTIKGKSSNVGKEAVLLARLKREAKGDPNVIADKRIYIHANNSPFYVSIDWTIGRCLDYLAQQLGIVNDNARTNDETRRLHLFQETTSMTLSPSQSAKLLNQGDRVHVYRGISFLK